MMESSASASVKTTATGNIHHFQKVENEWEKFAITCSIVSLVIHKNNGTSHNIFKEE